MNAKVTTVALESTLGRQEFTVAEAESLLRMKNPQWSLSKDSPYEFVNNALQRRTIEKKGERVQK